MLQNGSGWHYSSQGKVREYVLEGFVVASTRDDSFYVRMLDCHEYFAEQI
ncbi:hypothetical protein SPSIL_052540 [Sporomusa silvacetica DSM 10669]|uniref:Uncharacterized protein n=1 Tax=Sporomusa silvacetica DSM 10669 TaxID=1123289 RepID=A0ABZ3ITH2_9FIRM|nr:hypothetical protein SPSIL_20850 [Sporomusa silvacetica DSM 10669]